MNIPRLVFLVFALVLEVLAASNFVNGENRVRVIAAGLAFWVASFIFLGN